MTYEMRSYRLQQYAQMVADRNASGLSVEDYCEKVGLRPDQYRYRAKAVRRVAAEALRNKSRAVTVDNQESKPATASEQDQGIKAPALCVELKRQVSQKPKPDSCIRIRYHEAEIFVDENTSSTLLQKVMEVMAHV